VESSLHPGFSFFPCTSHAFLSFHLLVACLLCTLHSFRRLFRKSYPSRLASVGDLLRRNLHILRIHLFAAIFKFPSVVPSGYATILGLKVFGQIVIAAASLAGVALQALDGSSPGTGRRTCTIFEALTGLASELGAMAASGMWPGYLGFPSDRRELRAQ
jgi:hypothetical protein